MRSLACATITVSAAALITLSEGSFPADEIKPCFDASCIGAAQPSQLKNRPQLLPYEPVADTSAVVIASDKMARFTVLTDHLIRMEYARVAGQFEDRASLAVLNRKLPVPAFKKVEADGVLRSRPQQYSSPTPSAKGLSRHQHSVLNQLVLRLSIQNWGFQAGSLGNQILVIFLGPSAAKMAKAPPI